MMQEKSSNDHDENKENLMKDLETTVEIKEKVIIFFKLKQILNSLVTFLNRYFKIIEM